MAKGRNFTRFALLIAIIIIIGLVIFIINMRKEYVGTDLNASNDTGVSYVDLGKLGEETGEGTPVIEQKEMTPVIEAADKATPRQEEATPTPKKQESATGDLQYIVVKEGDLVGFPKLKASDPDGNKVTFSFSKPLNSSGQWQTKRGDAGTYDVIITASDGIDSTNQKVRVIVELLNNPPAISIADTISYNEGETILLEPKVTDLDKDKVTVEYSGYMSSNTKTLGYNDQGKHEVIITADDGKDKTSKKVTINVVNVNRKPVFTNVI